MNEKQFDDLIDCRFPYASPKAKKLARLACAISPNAAFQVAHELARLPRYTKVSKKVRQQLLSILYVHLKHPLKNEILQVVNSYFNKKIPLTVNQSLSLMHRIKPYTNMYVALSIVYFACDDTEGCLEKVWNDIVNHWKQRRVPVTTLKKRVP